MPAETAATTTRDIAARFTRRETLPYCRGLSHRYHTISKSSTPHLQQHTADATAAVKRNAGQLHGLGRESRDESTPPAAKREARSACPVVVVQPGSGRLS